ncbi:MAG: leucine-rich repeat domain-containing protein [Clostridia bacterium]|nr:leucine-rich repeat domain-containing protein [Clostridia bacterium]
MKHIHLFLVALFVGVLLFACAAADQLGGFEFTLNDDGTATITGYVGVETEELEIPAELVKKTKKSGETRVTVTAIGDGAFAKCRELTRVIIQEGITDIGAGAFSKCENLAEVIIPEGVTRIGNDAFYECALVTIDLPDSVVEIGRNPFSDCFDLKEIHVSPDCKGLAVIDGVLFSKADKRLVCYPGGLEREEYAVPDGIRIIDSAAFPGTGMKYDSIYDMYINVYHGPSSLFIPGSVESIDRSTFYQHKNLTQVIIQEGVTSIGQDAFGGTGLVSLIIPNSVTSIGEGAFMGCRDLMYVSLPDGLTAIEQGTFCNCSELRTIILPQGLKRIGYENYDPYLQSGSFGAFAGCSNLTSITIPDTLEVIGEYVFLQCTSLTSISIPGNVTRIGRRAFQGCTNLAGIVIPDSVTEIGEAAFAGCSGLTEIVLPGSIGSVEAGLFSATVSADMRYSQSPEIRSSLTGVVLEEGITSIGASAFFRCDHLTEIVIPETVTSIGMFAFAGCDSLTSITIPSSVTEIGNCAFDTLDFQRNTAMTIYVERNSYAAEYCKEFGYNYTYPDALDWLNN